LAEGVWPGSSEDGSESPLTGTISSAENGKSDLRISVLDGSGSSDLVLLGKDCGSDDGDGIRRSSVISCHFSVKLTDSTIQGNISVLLVHVVVSGSGLVSEDNAEGFHVIWSTLEDLVDSENLSLSALGLELSSQVVPKLGLSDNFISCEESNGIDFGVSVLFSGQLASEHKVLSDLTIGKKIPSFGVRSQWDLGHP
jgi:hypothetical protein